MAGLRDLLLKPRYRTLEDDMVSDFYVPCLSVAVEYDRAVGYFTSGALALAAPALAPFLANGGRMRLVTSPRLTQEDVDAMVAGYEDRERIIAAALCREITAADLPDPVRDTLSCLSWLISHQRLEVRIALIADGNGIGMYHEKLGVFRDAGGTRVAFQGSANESVGGLAHNFESILVFSSARPEQIAIVDQLDADFQALWDRRLPALDVIDLPAAVERMLLETYSPERTQRMLDRTRSNQGPGVPSSSVELRPYQEAALTAWFAAKGRGVLAMATGTGKTITALAISSRLGGELAKQQQGLVVVVVCPYQHLVIQWIKEAEAFGFDPVACFQSRSQWEAELSGRVTELRAGARSTVMAVATNATFGSPAFQDVLRNLPADSLFIADEMHNLGAAGLRERLPDGIRFRLGLSATPIRHRDNVGTDALEKYFGETVYELGLDKAVRIGALTPYRYHPVIVEFTDDELETYLVLSEKIGALSAMLDDGDDDEALMALLIKRARLIASAREKVPRLVALLAQHRGSTHNLIYCGDGRVESDDGEDERQVEAVVRALGQELGMAVNRYTADVDVGQRDVLRARFASGELNALVAIRCLDEGVDIPETRSAYILASSTNPRQYIQRRGRLLRRSPGKDLADIYDFIVVPPASADEAVDPSERRLIARELNRVAEFAGLAVNGPEAMAELRDLRMRYNLLHLGV